MANEMFCFQCEQTAGCKGCTGKAGVCGKQSDTAHLQDEITGALIGLAGAVSGNEGLISENTNKLVLEGLFACVTNVDFDNEVLGDVIKRIHAEKSRIVPNCSSCMSKCGKTDDYDMQKLWNAE